MERLPPRHAPAVTVLNRIGGVGKTHTAWLRASVCEEKGKCLLAFDLDTEGNFSRSFLPEPDGKPGVESLFDPAAEQDPHALICRTAFPHIDVVPARPSLAPFTSAGSFGHKFGPGDRLVFPARSDGRFFIETPFTENSS